MKLYDENWEALTENSNAGAENRETQLYIEGHKVYYWGGGIYDVRHRREDRHVQKRKRNKAIGWRWPRPVSRC